MCTGRTVMLFAAKDSDTIDKVLKDELELFDTWLGSTDSPCSNKEQTECILFETNFKRSRVEN